MYDGVDKRDSGSDSDSRTTLGSHSARDSDSSRTTLGSSEENSRASVTNGKRTGFRFRPSGRYTQHTLSDSESDSAPDDERPKKRKMTPENKADMEYGSCVAATPGKCGRMQEDTSSKSSRCSMEEKPKCNYGLQCYRKNPSHRREFCHSFPSTENEVNIVRNNDRVFSDGLHLVRLQLQHQSGTRTEKNISELDLADILDDKVGNLISSIQFSYMFEVSWLVNQYPRRFRTKPLLLVHGYDGIDKSALEHDVMQFDHISLCKAKLRIPYGTHHTKMMMLNYDEGLRICIHTANLIKRDWAQKTQGLWLSPLFPRLDLMGGASAIAGDSCTGFKKDLLNYLHAYADQKLQMWTRIVEEHDLSSANVYLIASVPGRHTGGQLSTFGHMKLRQVLELHQPAVSAANNWPVAAQFSSIGSLGPDPGHWLTTEFFRSVAPGWKVGDDGKKRIYLVYPCVEDVRTSLEGYLAGGSLPYHQATAQKQTWLNTYLCKWRAECSNRTRAMPHIKTYCRFRQDGGRIAWLLLTSANLSKAAWGVLEKRESQLMIRSFELGVLMIAPTRRDESNSEFGFKTEGGSISFPFDLPPVAYSHSDRPWIVDASCSSLPDTHGHVWCPT